RSGIAQVLGRRAQEAAVAIPLLKGALDDPEPAVRADAAQALAKLADKTLDPSALQGLVLALADADVSVRTPAVNGIERLTGRLADPAVDAVFGGAVGDAAAKALAAALLDEDVGVAGVAAQALGELGPRAAAAVPQLQAALMSPHSNIASDVAKALAKLGPPGIRALLVGVRQGGSPPDGIQLGTIRWAALSALEDIASPKAFGAQTDAVVAAIITALADSRTDVRAEAANVLGLIGPAAHAAVAPLKNALLQLTEDDNEDDIAALAIGLGHLGAQAAPALLDVLAGGDPAVAAAAAQGLGQMELGALGAEQNQVVAGLLAAMHRADANVRGAAAMGLGDFGLQKVDLGPQRARVIAALKAQAAHDADQVAQFQASTALGLLGVNS
ncbi:MAG TPA: HEAT repeat domain-containing protein, partial [Limnochordia bacterium]|nr:HEAT repeat domain-containing protein [Limnochordia bacterium]